MSQPMARGIERWPLDKLIPYAKNPRTHSDTQVAQIAKSIREFGFTNPLLVDSQCSIIAGHGRLLAARQLRMTEVPVIVLDHLTDAQKRAYILADNQLALNAGWDDQLLPAELASLKELEYDLHLIGSMTRSLRGCSPGRTLPKDSQTKTRSGRSPKHRSRWPATCGSSGTIACFAATL